MITILFPAGAFGSTIEYCIRRFSAEFETVNATILDNGSMHSFAKEFHPTTIEQYKDILNSMGIVTPVYPNNSLLSAVESVDEFIKISKSPRVVFITLNDSAMVERNWLFSYYKIYKIGIDQIIPKTYDKWNKNYTSDSDMMIWERREWLSFIIKDSIKDFTSAAATIQPDWLKISSEDIISNFKLTIFRIFDYLGLTFIDDNIDGFIEEWNLKQQYILNEMSLINLILKKICLNEYYSWEKLSLVGEAIIQNRLINLGYNLKCFDLNVFPTNTAELSSLCG